MKGQVSNELFVVMGFIILIFIPAIIFIYYDINNTNTKIQETEIYLVITKMAEISNTVGYAGPGSALKAEFEIPSSVEKITFRELGEGGEVLVNLRNGGNISQVTKFPFETYEIKGNSRYKLEFFYNGVKINVSKVE